MSRAVAPPARSRSPTTRLGAWRRREWAKTHHSLALHTGADALQPPTRCHAAGFICLAGVFEPLHSCLAAADALALAADTTMPERRWSQPGPDSEPPTRGAPPTPLPVAKITVLLMTLLGDLMQMTVVASRSRICSGSH